MVEDQGGYSRARLSGSCEKSSSGDLTVFGRTQLRLWLCFVSGESDCADVRSETPGFSSNCGCSSLQLLRSSFGEHHPPRILSSSFGLLGAFCSETTMASLQFWKPGTAGPGSNLDRATETEENVVPSAPTSSSLSLQAARERLPIFKHSLSSSSPTEKPQLTHRVA